MTNNSSSMLLYVIISSYKIIFFLKVITAEGMNECVAQRKGLSRVINFQLY